MSNDLSNKELLNFEDKLIYFSDLKMLKRKKDTAEIVRFVAQQICQNCIEECHKLKSRLIDD